MNPLSRWLAKPGGWAADPLEAWHGSGGSIVPGVVGVFLIGLSTFGLAAARMRWPLRRFVVGYCGVFLLATLAYMLAGQEVIKHYNLEYALWALLIGLLISNTIGTPDYLRTAACTEFYIKTGLVLLGAEVLFPRLLALGVPGICVAWIVTPVVLITTFWFGQRILKIESPTLNMVISADMSVCGVSAAIASAAACKAKREELSLAIGMSLSFTVVMMVVMPAVIRMMGLGEIVGGAWMGGTIDATGAVAAAGAMLGDRALQVAATVKMIQNILIGFVAFGIAVYWTTRVELRGGHGRGRDRGDLAAISQVHPGVPGRIDRVLAVVCPGRRRSGHRRCGDRWRHQDAAELVLLSGLCEYRPADERPGTGGAIAGRQAAGVVRRRPVVQPGADFVDGVADVREGLSGCRPGAGAVGRGGLEITVALSPLPCREAISGGGDQGEGQKGT